MKKTRPKGPESSGNLNDLFAELKAEYLEAFPHKVRNLEKLWQQKNRRGLEDEFHKLKGTGTTYGMNEVSEVSQIMESLCYYGHDQLGLGMLLGLELLRRIVTAYTNKKPVSLAQDPLFDQLNKMHSEVDAA